ncbi:zinc finger protein 704-like [Xenia sp. Carnegie-2017]|uniref:zinc finger protein 704-like n=1 Tax=Xenia sp. Carnegie-2017 TaxID=2897299 RepID=UPI001F034251|nr:zinc finger protein 704-like [Xenia sp. Carnegie-2017]XP_046864761.1 zinc finger protein 704-like [Xenia sp. Carnegie-2017]
MKTRAKTYQVEDNGQDNISSVSSTTLLNDVTTPTNYTNLFDKDFLKLFDDSDLALDTFPDFTSPNLLTAWNPGDWNPLEDSFDINVSLLSPPTTPEESKESLDVKPSESLFTETLSTISSSSLENTESFDEVVSRKRPKREQTRKCRKVYGINNKKLWCTQCRWKKACSRFNT